MRIESVFGGTDCFAVCSKSLRDAEEDCSIEVAVSPSDLDALYALRYHVYCKEMHTLDPDGYPDQRERDSYDDHSVHFILRRNGVIIGTIRLIKDSSLGFLTEEASPLPPHIPRHRTLEPSRLVIDPRARGKRLLLLLLRAAERWSRENGYTHWCFTAQKRLYDFYLSIGWKIQPLRKPIEYHRVIAIPGIRTLI